MERVHGSSVAIARRVGVRTAAVLLSLIGFGAIGAEPDKYPTAASPSTGSPLCASRPGGGLPMTLAQWAEGAQFFAGLGDFHRAVTTNSMQAQAYFDQGMRFIWGFNHDEATRSFAQAAQEDPRCAMCYWGIALTVGPNYNMPMMAQPRAKVAWAALRLAEWNAGSTTRSSRL